MSQIELYIKPQDEAEFKLSDKFDPRKVKIIQANFNSPQITGNYLQIPGSDGQLLNNVTFNASTFTINLGVSGMNGAEFRLLKSEVYSLFMGRKLLRIRTNVEPAKAAYVLPKPVEIISNTGTAQSFFEFQLDVPRGYRQTPFNSDEIYANKQLLQYGMNLDVENLPTYHFVDNQFVVFNPSDLAIDPYIQHHALKWVIKGAGNLKVTNATNGSSFSTASSINGTFTLNGVDGSQQTDFGHIILEKGNNAIQVTGLSAVDVTISFPFLYF